MYQSKLLTSMTGHPVDIDNQGVVYVTIDNIQHQVGDTSMSVYEIMDQVEQL